MEGFYLEAAETLTKARQFWCGLEELETRNAQGFAVNRQSAIAAGPAAKGPYQSVGE
jgi:hypothetical protein